MRVKHPTYKGPKFVPQAVKHNVQNQGSDARPIGRRSRKRRGEQSKEKKKKRKTRKNRRQLGLPVLLVKTKIKERIFYAEAYKKQKYGEKKAFAKKIDVDQRKLQRWVKDLPLYKKCGRRSRYLAKKKRNGKFFEQQKELFRRFCARRQRGVKVSYMWLRVKMKFICRTQAPRGYDEQKHKFTNKWVRAFCKRWGISSQRKTNKKSKCPFEKLHLNSNFLCYIIYIAPKSRGNVEL